MILNRLLKIFSKNPYKGNRNLAQIISKGAVLPMDRLLENYCGPDSLPFETKIKLVLQSKNFNTTNFRDPRSINCSLFKVEDEDELVAVGNRLLAHIHRSNYNNFKTDSPIRIIELLRKSGCISTFNQDCMFFVFLGKVPQTCREFEVSN